MSRNAPRLFALALVALPLALTACKKDAAGDAAAISGAPIAKIAPPAGKAWVDQVATTPEGGYLMGNPQAPIKLVEYGSLSCPHCAKLAQDGFQKLRDDYVASGRVSFEFRSFAIHPQDVPLTVLAACGDPSAFIPRAEQIYTNFDAMTATAEKGIQQAQAAMSQTGGQRFIGMADALGYTEFFAARGVSKDQARACLMDEAKATAVAANADKYGKDGIDATPTLIVNGNKLPGNTWAELEPVLQQAGAR